MNRFAAILTGTIVLTAAIGVAQQPTSTGPYKIIKTARVGGEGNWDYIYLRRRRRTPHLHSAPRHACRARTGHRVRSALHSDEADDLQSRHARARG